MSRITDAHTEHHLLAGATGYPPQVARRYREAGWWTGELLGDLLRTTASRSPDQPALIGPHREWTYSQADRRAEDLAEEFWARGIGPHDRVVVHMPSAPEFVLVLFALWRLGAVPVFTLPGHGSAEVGAFIESSGAVAVVTGTESSAGTAQDGLAAIPTAEPVAMVPVGPDATIDDQRPFSSEGYRGSQVFRPHPQDIALLQLSGGTTGRNKLIPRTHDDYLYSVRASNGICGVTEETVMLVVLPAPHNFTMSSPGILGVLHAGGCCVFASDPLPATAFAVVARYRVTMTALVPSLLLGWLGSRHLVDADLSSLRNVLVGGAPLDPGTARRVGRELGARLQQVFGMAEGLVCYTRADDSAEVVENTQGRPISPGDELRILADGEREAGVDEVGELLVRGPYTIRGYFRPDPAAAASFTSDGFYRTGDLVSRDVQGNITVRGRVKDVVNRAGEKIHPAEVEGALRSHPAVADAAVRGVEDPDLGERLEAYVVPVDTDEPPRAFTLRRHLKSGGLAHFKVPDTFRFVATLPRTAVGKTRTARLGS